MNKTTDINATKAAIESCTHVRHIDAVEKMIVAFQIKWELERPQNKPYNVEKTYVDNIQNIRSTFRIYY